MKTPWIRYPNTPNRNTSSVQSLGDGRICVPSDQNIKNPNPRDFNLCAQKGIASAVGTSYPKTGSCSSSNYQRNETVLQSINVIPKTLTSSQSPTLFKGTQNTQHPTHKEQHAGLLPKIRRRAVKQRNITYHWWGNQSIDPEMTDDRTDNRRTLIQHEK